MYEKKPSPERMNVSAILGIGFPKTVHYILGWPRLWVAIYCLDQSPQPSNHTAGICDNENRKNTSLSSNPKHRVSPFKYHKTLRINFLWKKNNLDSHSFPISPKNAGTGSISCLLRQAFAKAFNCASQGQRLSEEFTRNPRRGGKIVAYNSVRWRKVGLVNSWIRPTSKAHHQSSKSGG